MVSSQSKAVKVLSHLTENSLEVFKMKRVIGVVQR